MLVRNYRDKREIDGVVFDTTSNEQPNLNDQPSGV